MTWQREREGADSQGIGVLGVFLLQGRPGSLLLDPGARSGGDEGPKDVLEGSEVRQQRLGSVLRLGLAWIAGGKMQNFCSKCRNFQQVAAALSGGVGPPESRRKLREMVGDVLKVSTKVGAGRRRPATSRRPAAMEEAGGFFKRGGCLLQGGGLGLRKGGGGWADVRSSAAWERIWA